MAFHENASAQPDSERAAPRKLGILVVDDEAGVRAVLDVAMRFEGFAVWLTANGREALDRYRQDHALIDIVLMDVRMPELDGPQTLAALRELNPRVRCCFISGDLGTYTERQLRNMGAAGVLYKPFALTDVTKVVRNLLTEAQVCTTAL